MMLRERQARIDRTLNCSTEIFARERRENFYVGFATASLLSKPLPKIRYLHKLVPAFGIQKGYFWKADIA